MTDTDATDAVLAERRIALRQRLLVSGYITNSQIAVLRGVLLGSARTFVSRERRKHRPFTVKHGRQVVVPLVLLNDHGRLTTVTQAVEILRPLGLDGWELWAWLESPSGWLSGEVPTTVFTTDPSRALAAVRAYGSELRATAPPETAASPLSGTGAP